MGKRKMNISHNREAFKLALAIVTHKLWIAAYDDIYCIQITKDLCRYGLIINEDDYELLLQYVLDLLQELSLVQNSGSSVSEREEICASENIKKILTRMLDIRGANSSDNMMRMMDHAYKAFREINDTEDSMNIYDAMRIYDTAEHLLQEILLLNSFMSD